MRKQIITKKDRARMRRVVADLRVLRRKDLYNAVMAKAEPPIMVAARLTGPQRTGKQYREGFEHGCEETRRQWHYQVEAKDVEIRKLRESNKAQKYDAFMKLTSSVGQAMDVQSRMMGSLAAVLDEMRGVTPE